MPDFQLIILYSSFFLTLFFEVFLLITYLEVRDEVKYERDYVGKNVTNFPSVTIIVPSFNEELTVAATVHSLLNLEYPKEKLSLILIDDGSSDKTLEVINQFKENPQVRVFSKQNEGSKYSAMNFGLKHVNTDLVGCLDADSFVNPDALKRIVPFFDKMDIMAVIPSIKVHEPKSFLQYIQRVEYSWGIFLRRMLSSLGALYVTPGPFSIFRTRVFQELGGYKQGHHTEDLEMALRMQKNHYRIVNSHGAHVYTVAPAKLKGLYKQRVRWTYGFLNNVIDYREMLFNRKYGNVGLFILPIGTVSIFSTLYMILRVVWRFIANVFDFFVRLQATGFNNKLHWPSFDWFFISTGTVPFLTTMAVILTLTILYLAVKLAEGRFKVRRELFYYLFVYAFIVPLWLIKAIFNTVFRREISWR